MDKAPNDRYEGDERVHDLNHPKQFCPHEADVLIIGSALEEELLSPVLVRVEEPSNSQQALTGDVFGDPKIDDGEHRDHFVEYQAVDYS